MIGAMQKNIFINYRRQTDAGIAGRVYDSLSLVLPGVSIFMDVDKLSPGDDFEKKLDETLASCDVLLAIIGPTWASILDNSGKTRIHNVDDYVRKELRSALGKDVRVIPILVGGAEMPNAAELPSDLAALSKRQAMEIRHERFKADVDALAQAIAPFTSTMRNQRWPVVAIAAASIIAVGAAGGLYLLRSNEHKFDGGAAVRAPSNQDSGPAWTDWMDRATYQREFDRQVKNEWYPRLIEARLQDGVVMYRAVYAPFPSSTFEFNSQHSVNDEEFAAFDAEMTAAGFKRIFQQRIVVDTRPFNQATWTKP